MSFSSVVSARLIISQFNIESYKQRLLLGQQSEVNIVHLATR